MISSFNFGKKGSAFFRHWAEIVALMLLIIGFIFSISALGSLFVSCLVIFLWGLFFGRIWYSKRKTFRFTWFLIMLGFLVGYILGVTFQWGLDKWWITTFLYVAGIYLSYYLHLKKYIKSSEY